MNQKRNDIVAIRDALVSIETLVSASARIRPDTEAWFATVRDAQAQAEALAALLRKMARKPDWACDRQGCYARASWRHSQQVPGYAESGVPGATGGIVKFCTPHSETSNLPRLKIGGRILP